MVTHLLTHPFNNHWSASDGARPQHNLPRWRRTSLPGTPRGSSKDHAQPLLLICTCNVPTPYTQHVQKQFPHVSPEIYFPSCLPGFFFAFPRSSRLKTMISIQSTGSGSRLPGFGFWFCHFPSPCLGKVTIYLWNGDDDGKNSEDCCED